MSPFAMLGDADALACEGDSCLLPAAVATVGALTPSAAPVGALTPSAAPVGASTPSATPADVRTEADPAPEAAVSR
ncbi:hypothetical protein ES689_03760 [Frigoribacterium sp. ACAM 257]|uniref:hypothetical protein n=1 Tax=Frigoribacterium sp. ACAM 257 TaxID=2508998 RepID=UPI0011B9884D|nr:hypothetical protein [Frigoribacterium sp. ACAM 257]TWX40575.1 hypothetical protein ES689_03760 [Frigoribacterium sp. ACAM 257]